MEDIVVDGVSGKVIEDFKKGVTEMYSGTDVDFAVELERALREYVERQPCDDTHAHMENSGKDGE